MSILTDSTVAVLVSDYANTDAAGKLNVLGSGAAMLAPHEQGLWPSMTVTVIVSVPSKYSDHEYSLSMELHDVTNGKMLQIPGMNGQLEPMRVQQVVTVPTVQVPPQFKKPTDITVDHVVCMNFPTGLPLQLGTTYEWRVQIDGQSVKHGRRRFHALGPAHGFVVGGPANAPFIPGVGQYVVDSPGAAPTSGPSVEEGQSPDE